MKKVWSLLLAIIIVLSSVVISYAADTTVDIGLKAEAATDYTQGYYTYAVENGEAIIGYVDPAISGSIIIPSTLGGCPVVAIFSEAFEGCNNLTHITIPDSVTSIGDGAFSYCTNLTNVIIPNSVVYMGSFVFSDCYNLKNVSLPDSITNIRSYTFANCYSFTDITIPDSVTSIGKSAFYGDFLLEYIHIPSSVTTIGENAIMSDEEKLSLIIEMKTELQNAKTDEEIQELELAGVTKESVAEWEASKATYICSDAQYCYAKEYANTNGIEFKLCEGHPAEAPDVPVIPDVPVTPSKNVYNIGEETYGFENYADKDSWGHCFGMSMTSSAYYLGELDITKIGADSVQKINKLTLTSSVKEPICTYQAIQGSYAVNATVAGGSYYKTNTYNINSDWNQVVNYVKNHDYDNEGSLQIGFRKEGEGGHAVNFLRYEEVNGQQRIYAYDNNFPSTETYFYKDSNGKINQEPYATFSGAIDCIALRDVATYFSKVDNFDFTRYIYADRDVISVSGVKTYPIDVGGENGEKVVVEIPADVEEITITPLVNNAEFTYLNKEYSFGNIDDDTVAIFKLADSSEDSPTAPEMNIIDKSEIVDFSIKTPSITTINYGDEIILHVDVQSLPAGASIKWTASNENFDYNVSADGITCKIAPVSSGDTTFTATVYDANGKVISSDEQTMESKAGFIQKILAFFKGIFGLNKVYEEVFKVRF